MPLSLIHISGVQVTADNETAGYVDKVVNGGLLDAMKGQNLSLIHISSSSAPLAVAEWVPVRIRQRLP